MAEGCCSGVGEREYGSGTARGRGCNEQSQPASTSVCNLDCCLHWLCRTGVAVDRDEEVAIGWVGAARRKIGKGVTWSCDEAAEASHRGANLRATLSKVKC